MAKKKKELSDYDMNSLLASLAQRVATVISRENDGLDFGETEFSVCGNPEDYQKIKLITKALVEKIINGSSKQEILDFTVGEMFPRVDISKLVKAIKDNKITIKHNGYEIVSYETRAVEWTVESHLPELIDDFIDYIKKGGEIKF